MSELDPTSNAILQRTTRIAQNIVESLVIDGKAVVSGFRTEIVDSQETTGPPTRHETAALLRKEVDATKDRIAHLERHQEVRKRLLRVGLILFGFSGIASSIGLARQLQEDEKTTYAPTVVIDAVVLSAGTAMYLHGRSRYREFHDTQTHHLRYIESLELWSNQLPEAATEDSE